MKVRRPWSVTWLAIGVLSLTGIHIIRLLQTIWHWDFLNTLPLSIPPLYFGITGLVWGISGLPSVWGLWRGKEWAPRYLWWITIIFLLYYWIDRTQLATSTFKKTNQPFAIGGTIFVLLLIYWIITRPRAKAFFGEMDDRQSQNREFTQN